MAFTSLKRSSVSRKEALVRYAREQLFGYQSGMPGEKEFLKPLKGRDAVSWYWPSKYMLADFNLSSYLYFQADRMCKKPSENPFKKVDTLFSTVNKHRKMIETFLKSVTAEAIADCPTLIDLQSVLELSKTPQKTLYGTHTSDNSTNVDNETMNYYECSKNLAVRRRYIDNMYYRRRLSYLELIKKKTFKQHKVKEHYLTHPDDKIVWPDNKGVVHRKWPSPY